MTVAAKFSQVSRRGLLTGAAAGGFLFAFHLPVRAFNEPVQPPDSTDGKFAPALAGVSAEHVYEAMITGPQNMPVFNDANLTPEQKADIITYLKYLDQNPSPGGFDLGSLGPVSEGLFIWIFGLGAVVGVTIWIAAKAN